MPTASIDLKQALDLARTGDVWLFRGYSAADRAIRVATNSPVNHVGMSVVIDDLPPLMWHAELGRSLPDLWSGSRHRGRVVIQGIAFPQYFFARLDKIAQDSVDERSVGRVFRLKAGHAYSKIDGGVIGNFEKKNLCRRRDQRPFRVGGLTR